MPRVKLTKSAIDALPTLAKDIVFWDSGCPGFGVKVTPKRRKVFIMLYRVAGARLRKYKIGPYGRVTLHQARVAALKIFAARTDRGERRQVPAKVRSDDAARGTYCLGRRSIRKGRLTLIEPSGRVTTFGEKRADQGEVVVRLVGPMTPLKLALWPDLYLGQAYMNGSLAFEREDL